MSVRPFKSEEEASVGNGFELESKFIRKRYQVVGSANNAADAIVELAANTGTIDDLTFPGVPLYRQPLTVRRLGHRLYESDVLYTPKNPVAFQKTIRGRTTGGTQKILGSFFTSKSSGAPDFKGLIGYNPKDQSVEGAEIVVPVQEWTIEVTYPIGYVTDAYLNGLGNLTGIVNSAAWSGRPAGSMLYLGAEWSQGNTEPTVVTHSVAFQRNIFNATIAGLKGVNKEGWDYLWFLTEDAEEGGLPIKKAKHWYSERVYPRANFTATLGF